MFETEISKTQWADHSGDQGKSNCTGRPSGFVRPYVDEWLAGQPWSIDLAQQVGFTNVERETDAAQTSRAQTPEEVFYSLIRRHMYAQTTVASSGLRFHRHSWGLGVIQRQRQATCSYVFRPIDGIRKKWLGKFGQLG